MKIKKLYSIYKITVNVIWWWFMPSCDYHHYIMLTASSFPFQKMIPQPPLSPVLYPHSKPLKTHPFLLKQDTRNWKASCFRPCQHHLSLDYNS